ncbi:hypothetical protein D9M68_993500 [compost metagenome]
MPLIYRRLAQVLFRQRRVGLDVVGTDRAACREAGNDKHGKVAFGQHGFLPGLGYMALTLCDYITHWSLVVHLPVGL